MSPLIPIIGISNCIGTHYYAPVGKTKIASYYMIAGSVCNLILNIALIPKLGATGAVIGSIGAELIITILFVLFDDRYVTWKDLLSTSWKKILAGIIMISGIALLKNLIEVTGIAGLFLKVLFGAILYMLMLFILRDEATKQAVNIIHERGRRA